MTFLFGICILCDKIYTQHSHTTYESGKLFCINFTVCAAKKISEKSK